MSSCEKLASAGPAGPVARKSKPGNSCSGSGSVVATPADTPSGSGMAAPSVVSTKVAKAKLPRKNRTKPAAQANKFSIDKSKVKDPVAGKAVKVSLAFKVCLMLIIFVVRTFLTRLPLLLET